MAEETYFRKALSDFTYEAASGGAIRHLADLGCTSKQIMEQLTFPTPYARVQKTVWRHLLDSKAVLLAEPGSEKGQEKADFIEEYDKYGRLSFRRTVSREPGEEPVRWHERRFAEDTCGKLAEYLERSCAEETRAAYMSCEFGFWRAAGTGQYEEALEVLDPQQREYIMGLLWEKQICYHRLDQRMREIAVRLYEAGKYHGNCFFLSRAEKLIL